ncbi:microsomal dipeptidase-like Zn-dependent dipeptidase [Pseudomonas fluvialis]|uniref:Microsomal dipeptidase-like Zn-dependent dipeptidase n=1 Tax=Pseudomonas fluvialis TaxID=1793966 RepID=A0A7X0BNQ9_9PSED|nr:dipeptidase [Pseudomonas fluvialis]MBB6339862.1 microsomal dipeptidase-like Zn-dependent dipeptidase [Pseudomonas fluvialis]
MRKRLLITGASLLLALGFFALPSFLDYRMNSTADHGPYQASAAAQALHRQLWIADLHDDALLWQRDPLQRHSYGHTDLPRLLEGNVGLQVFAAVTKTPRGLNYTSNAADSDNVTPLIIAQRWPRATWSSLLQRALYQSERLQQTERDSQGLLQIIRSREELRQALARRNPEQPTLAAILATEGLHPLEGQLANVDVLFNAGYRIAGLTHFFDNELGGSAHGLAKGGLTPFGREVVKRLEQRHMLIDLAHASKPMIDDVLAMATRPLLVSHTGVAGTCPGPRNLSDEHLRRIAAGGGLVGIGYWDGAVCATSVDAIIKAIRYSVDLIGVEHVALGSDFDGTIHAPFDTRGLVLLTDGLLKAGFSAEQITAIMGGNVQRLLLQYLP